MNTINFCSGGKLGDFIHSLYVVKNICEQRNAKANLYLDENGDIWTYGIVKAYTDLDDVIRQQEYINIFGILPKSFSLDDVINLNDWRKEVATTHAETGKYNKCWSELLSEHYGFEIPKEYKWLEVKEVDEANKGKTVIHRSLHHHSSIKFWESQLSYSDDFIFVTTDIEEYNYFPLKSSLPFYKVKTVSEWITAIASCKKFIGNQSAGFAIASALDVPRICELYPDVAVFYENETKYSKNIKL